MLPMSLCGLNERMCKNVQMCVTTKSLACDCDPFKTCTWRNKVNRTLDTLMCQLTHEYVLQFGGCGNAGGTYMGLCAHLYDCVLKQMSETDCSAVLVCACMNGRI